MYPRSILPGLRRLECVVKYGGDWETLKALDEAFEQHKLHNYKYTKPCCFENEIPPIIFTDSVFEAMELAGDLDLFLGGVEVGVNTLSIADFYESRLAGVEYLLHSFVYPVKAIVCYPDSYGNHSTKLQALVRLPEDEQKRMSLDEEGKRRERGRYWDSGETGKIPRIASANYDYYCPHSVYGL